MIETVALFFAVMSIYFYLLFVGARKWIYCLLFSVSASIGMLQKATTVLPVILVTGFASLHIIKPWVVG